MMYTLFETLFLSNEMRQKLCLFCTMQKTPEKHSNTFIVLHVFKQTAVKLSFDELKWLLSCYWKKENVVEVQRRWRVEFGTPPATRVTITRIRDKFEADGTVQDLLKGKYGRQKFHW